MMRCPATEQQITDWIIGRTEQLGEYGGSFIASFWFIRLGEADPTDANWDLNLARTEGCVSRRCMTVIERVVLPLALAQFLLVPNRTAAQQEEKAVDADDRRTA